MDPSQIEQNIHNWAHELDYDRKQLLVVMQKIQESYQSISEESMRILADDFQIQPSEVYSLATFFTRLCTCPKGKYNFKLCNGLSCDLQQKEDIISTLQNELGVKFGETSPDGLFSLEFSQCMGMCDQGPVLSVNDQVFTRITPEKLETIIALCRHDQETDVLHPEFDTSGFWGGRDKTTSYTPILRGSALSRFNMHSHEKLLDELVNHRVISEDLKIELDPSYSEAPSNRILVCNTDLSQTGSYIDRILLADHYDLFLEGMVISTALSGAQEGIIYLRPEYDALKPVLAAYLEGLNLLMSSEEIPFPKEEFNCNIDIRTSPGFIAGGIGKSLEVAVNSNRFSGKTAASTPTSVISMDVKAIVEVGHYLANIDCQPNQSQENSTRIFAISGDCALPGVYEMPAAASINDLLKISESHSPKAVQVGGITGKFVLPSQFSEPMPAELTSGNATIIVYGPTTNFHDVAIKLLQYSACESCGQCAPCREGSVKLLQKFQKKEKRHKISVLELNSIANCMQQASKCEFGQNAANGFLSLIQNFPELV